MHSRSAVQCIWWSVTVVLQHNDISLNINLPQHFTLSRVLVVLVSGTYSPQNITAGFSSLNDFVWFMVVEVLLVFNYICTCACNYQSELKYYVYTYSWNSVSVMGAYACFHVLIFSSLTCHESLGMEQLENKQTNKQKLALKLAACICVFNLYCLTVL